MYNKPKTFAFFAALIIGVTVIFSTMKKEVTVYLTIAQSSLDSIDIRLTIDSLKVYENYITNNPFRCKVIKVNLASGIYEIEVSSIHQQINIKKYLLIFVNQHIVVEFYENFQPEDKPSFLIRNRFFPFYLE